MQTLIDVTDFTPSTAANEWKSVINHYTGLLCLLFVNPGTGMEKSEVPYGVLHLTLISYLVLGVKPGREKIKGTFI